MYCIIVLTMYIDRPKRIGKNKTYTQILLRESYRVKVDGKSKVKHRTFMNLTHLPPLLVEAIKLALKNGKLQP